MIALIDPTFVGVVTVLLGGGVLSAIAVFKKAGPEVESISVSTMKDVIEELRNELSRLGEENRRLHRNIEALEGVARENEELRRRIERLEKIADGQ